MAGTEVLLDVLLAKTGVLLDEVGVLLADLVETGVASLDELIDLLNAIGGEHSLLLFAALNPLEIIMMQNVYQDIGKAIVIHPHLESDGYTLDDAQILDLLQA